LANDRLYSAFIRDRICWHQNQGTIVVGINPAGRTPGHYIDAAGVHHGFVRAPDGSVTRFNDQGAGTASGQGTTAESINTPGMIEGQFIDASGVYHGFLRSKQGEMTTYDVPGAARLPARAPWLG
jgi:hypothetical protein